MIESTVQRWPHSAVFVADADYRGQPDMSKHPLLRRHLMEHFAQEIAIGCVCRAGPLRCKKCSTIW